jgi:hypothetical protein
LAGAQRFGIFIALFLIAASPCVGAQSEKFSATVDLFSKSGGRFEGEIHNSSIDVRSISLPYPTASTNFSILVKHGNFRVVNRPVAVTGSSSESPFGQQTLTENLPERQIFAAQTAGTLRAITLGSGAQVLIVRPEEAQKLSYNGYGSMRFFPLTDRPAAFAPEPSYSMWPDQAWDARIQWNSSAPMAVDLADGRIFLSGGIFEIPGAPGGVVRTGQFLNRTESAVDPLGWNGRWVWDRIGVEIQVSKGTAFLDADRGHTWTLLAREAIGEWSGSLLFGDLHGTLTIDGQARRIEAQTLELSGTLTGAIVPRRDVGEWSWSGHGTATMAALDGKVSLGQRSPAGANLNPTLFAGAIALAIYAVGAALRRTCGATFGIVFAKLGARIKSKDVATNPLRQQLLALLQDQPPYVNLTTFVKRASDKFGISKWAARYHVHMLARSRHFDLIQRPDGRQLFVGPNHGAFENSQKYVLAAIGNPLARAIGEEILQRSTVGQADLIKAIQERVRTGLLGSRKKVSRIAVFKWIRQLESVRSGPAASSVLIQKAVIGRRIRYSATVQLEEAIRQAQAVNADFERQRPGSS